MGEGLRRRRALRRRTDGREHDVGGVRRDRRDQTDCSPADGEPRKAEPERDTGPLPGCKMIDRRAEHQRCQYAQSLSGQGHHDGRHET